MLLIKTRRLTQMRGIRPYGMWYNQTGEVARLTRSLRSPLTTTDGEQDLCQQRSSSARPLQLWIAATCTTVILKTPVDRLIPSPSASPSAMAMTASTATSTSSAPFHPSGHCLIGLKTNLLQIRRLNKLLLLPRTGPQCQLPAVPPESTTRSSSSSAPAPTPRSVAYGCVQHLHLFFSYSQPSKR